VISHIDEWLPVQEIAGFRLFELDLRGFGLLEDAASEEQLAAYFYPEANDADCPPIASANLPTQSLQR
jgi:predicted secreted protein